MVINQAKIYGISTQNGTPTPSVPVDIECNNGIIKYSLNMCNVNSQTALVGYYITSSGVVTADSYNWIYQNFIPVKSNTTYTLTMSTPVYYVSISEYSTADDSGFVIRKAGSTGSNTTLTITTGATTNYVRFGTNINRTVVTLDKVLAINWMLNIGNAMPYTPYVEGGIYIDGTNEVLTMGTQTANIETLLSVGNYKDIQEIINGDITRKVGVKVLDGTEAWVRSYYNSLNYFTNNISGINADTEKQLLCTHFDISTRGTPVVGCVCVRSGRNGFLFTPIDQTTDSVEKFKAYLADQYNAGTPVIVIYPLATATTESVTSQTLTAQEGTNIISSNKGAREMEVKYYRT